MMTPSGPMREKSLLFAVRIVNLCRYLTEEKAEYILSKQVLRSGTNPGAMVREAENAESGSDFIHKLSIAQKEIAETQYWLELLFKSQYIKENEFNSLYDDSMVLLKLFRSAILTRKKNLRNKE
ncbi:MAG: four helix bundle protein [Chitinophagales bacterium]|nr:four helix bundle protein [Chitinophagales bacterium]